jgi:hypothetical protein
LFPSLHSPLSPHSTLSQAVVLRLNIEEARRAKILLQRKLKEEGATHNAEKKRLQVR